MRAGLIRPVLEQGKRARGVAEEMPSLHQSQTGISRARGTTHLAVATLIASVMLGWPVSVQAAAPPTEVNTCGQVFSGNGFLSGDLDCSAAGVVTAVTIQGGTFDLQGFTLTAPIQAVGCLKSCKVISDPPGGTITSAGSSTISAVGAGASPSGGRVNIRISDVFVTNGRVNATHGNIKLIDSTVTGIASTFPAVDAGVSSTARLLRSVVTANAGTGVSGTKAKIIDSTVSNNGGIGVFGSRSVSIKRSTVSASGSNGVQTNNKSVRLTDSSVTGNGMAGVDLAIFAKAKVVRSDISGNGTQGIIGPSKRIIVRESTITNNGAEGIRQDAFGVAKLTDSTITGNALDGVAQTALDQCKLILQGTTTVAGNGTDPSCGVSRTCADLTSCDPPEVDPASTCNTSYDVNSGFPGMSWGVCALD